MKKIFRAVIGLLVAAMLILGASSGNAFAGGIYGWGSAGCSGGAGGYGYGGCGYGGCGGGGCAGGGYGGCGSGSCGFSGIRRAYPEIDDYAPYIIGHGPMFPAGDAPEGVFWFGADRPTVPAQK